MNVFLVPESVPLSSRFYTGLTYDERLALWAVRHLFGPSILHKRGYFSLRAFFGREIEPVLSLAATIYVTGVNALSSTICNKEELDLLAQLEKEQNELLPTYPQTKKDLIIKQLSAVLAGHGCWLPHHYLEEESPSFLLAAE